MSGEGLHPNLARIAAEYDDIVRRYRSGQLTGQQASAQISKLRARDDVGVSWTLDPATGAWWRRTLQGQWVADDPPASGLLTADGYHLAKREGRFTPDTVIETEVAADDPSVRYQGATRRAARDRRDDRDQTRDRGRRRTGLLAVVFVAVLVAALLSWFPAGGGSELPSSQTPTTEEPDAEEPEQGDNGGLPGFAPAP